MDINITRKIVSDILNADLGDVEYYENESFHVNVPRSFPGIDSAILDPRNTWLDKKAFDLRAARLASEFSAHFDKAYSHKNLSDDIRLCCPGK